MDGSQIKRVGRGIEKFLGEFSDCFGRCDTESYLGVYVGGQNSNLQRKSVEPMALRVGLPPRSLQAFLSLLNWDEGRVVDRLQQMVMRDHGHPWAIGLVDETGSPKKGNHTAGVQRQWCGRTGKVDNCVVSVHLGYTVGGFHCLLDSDLFLPKSWADDPARREEAGIPEEVTHRTKPQIALDQIRRALANGVRVAAWTFDEHYGQSYAFLDGLDGLGQTYVAEVSPDFCGWAVHPKLLYRATPQEMRQQGKKRRFPRLAGTAAKVSEVRDLLRHSPAFRDQSWMPIHIKEGEKGPLVREVKVIRFWMQRDHLPTRAHWLIAARNPEQPEEVKFFVSNAPAGTPIEWLTYVGYSRWPIERCFEEDKDELGFDHFEVRGWKAIHRHMYLTQVSHLYLNKAREQLVSEEQAQTKAGVFSLPSRGRRSPRVSGRKLDGQSDPRGSGCLVSSGLACAVCS
jgi:SRSO17 transposase